MNETTNEPADAARPAGLLLPALALLAPWVFLGLLWLLPLGRVAPAPAVPAAPTAPHTAEDPGDRPARETGPVRVWLEPSGPRAAEVLLEGERLGAIAVTEEGTFSGTAIGRIAVQAKRFVAREVRVERHPDLPPELSDRVQRLFFLGGATRARLVSD